MNQRQSGTGVRALLMCTLVVSCQSPEVETGAEGPGECKNGIDETVPEAGAADAYFRGNVEVRLDDPDESSPSVELDGPEGSVAGMSNISEDLTLVWFDPKAPLEPLTAYTATVSYCKGHAAFDFVTSELGLPCEVPLEGRVFWADLRRSRTLDPAGAGDLLSEFLAFELLIGIQAVGDASIDASVARGIYQAEPPEQEPCPATLDLTLDYSDPPTFAYGPADHQFATRSGTLTLIDFELHGTFAPNGEAIGGGELKAAFDVRELAQSSDLIVDGDDYCDLLETFSAPCMSCASDGQPYCVEVHLDQIRYEIAPETIVEPSPGSSEPECEDYRACGTCPEDRVHGRLALAFLLGGLVIGLRRRK